MILRRFAFGAVALAVLVWLLLRPPHEAGGDPRFLQREFPAMGTWITLSVYLDEGQDRAAADTAIDDAVRFLQDYPQRWSAWGDGALGQINRALASGAAAEIPAAMQPLFRRAIDAQQRSAGAFDARIGALVKLWGFDEEAHYRSQPPPETAIAAALAALRAAPTDLRDCDGAPSPGCYGPAPGIAWDFGAIAKGDAVDQAVARLQAAGLRNAIVNAGGNLTVRGRRGDRAWRIAIRHPRPEDGQRLLATLEPDDESVITSGDYERYFEYQGRRYHHLLDPQTGAPARGLQSVTVVDTDAALADAASTALFVAGPQRWRETARALGVDEVLVVRDDGALEATAKLAPRLDLPGAPKLTVIP